MTSSWLLLLLAVSQATSEIYWVRGLNMSVGVDSRTGTVVYINATNTGFVRAVDGKSFITDDPTRTMSTLSINVAHQPLHQMVTVTRQCRVKGYGTVAMQDFEVEVKDVIKASTDPAVGGVEWIVTTTGSPGDYAQPWRAAVGTELTILERPGDGGGGGGGGGGGDNRAAAAAPLDYWLPQNGASMAEDVLAMRNESSPPYESVALGYNYLASGRGGGLHMPYPLFVWASSTGAAADPNDGGGGIIVAPSLNDSTLGATADLNASHLLFTRLFNRQSASTSISWTTHLGALNPPDPAAVDPALPPAVRQDDPWRDGLRFAMAVSPTVFASVTPAANPATGQATSLANVGLGMYTCAAAGSINVSTTISYAAANTLWDASFWWPYIGMFLPPVQNTSAMWSTNVGASEQATCSKPGGIPFKHGQKASAQTVAGHLEQMHAAGVVAPLSYFNLFEFGQNVKWPLPQATPSCSTDATAAACWNDSSVMLASTELRNAILFTSNDTKKPTASWQGAIVLDPGVQAYHDHLVEQAARHFSLLGRNFHGIVIDRTDWSTQYSKSRDDGTAWCGAPCASMLPAWMNAAKDVSAIIHKTQTPPPNPGSEPLMMVNYAGSARMELLAHADGIFSEDGDSLLNAIGLSTLAMPAIGWTYPGTRKAGGLDDSYMQHHLRMGVSPMAPTFAADHSLADNDANVNALFKDYGPLFRMIRGVKWGIDRSHVIRVDPPPAQGGPKHNVFEAMDPLAAMVPWTVVLALADTSVDSVLITLRLPFGGQPAGCDVQLPGVEMPSRVPAVVVPQDRVGQEVLYQLTARLLRGCSVLQCSLE